MCGNNAIRSLRALLTAFVFWSAALIVLVSIPTASAQVRIEVPLYVTDGPNRDTLHFGILQGANFCVVAGDSMNGHDEFFLPPVPPAGVFDTRMIWPRAGTNPACFDQGTENDFRPFTSSTQKDTFRVKSQVGGGTTMVLSWPAGLSTYFNQLTIRYFDGSGNINTDMLTNTSVNITDAGDPATANIFSSGVIAPVVPPPVPGLVSPPSGATGQPTSVTLRWNVSSTAQTYHVQLSADSTFATSLVNDSTLVDTTRTVVGLSFSTKYFWRVRARIGSTASSFSSPFNFTTQFQPPAAPILVSPGNGQPNAATSLTLTWNAVSGATSYRVQVATNSNFTTGIVLDDSTVTATSRNIAGLLNSTQYFWRVRATNPGGPGPYSTTFSFTTIVVPPPAPSLTSPPDGQTNVSLVPTMTWNAAPTATSYRLQVARDTLFAILVFDDSLIVGTSRQIAQLISNTTYYWRVRAKNIGGVSPFSSRFGFTTTQAPSTPLQLLPADSATGVSSTPRFVWATVIGATSYTLQVATEPTFSSPILNDSTITDTAKTVAPLPYGSILLWRVRAKNSSGPSGFSPARVFTVMLAPPSAPLHVAPTNNAVNVPVTVTIRWTNAPLATGYHLQVALDTLMTNLFLSDTALTDSFRILNVLPSMANYWRIRARNIQNAYGPFTPSHRFITGNFPPAIPTPLSPANGDTGITRTPTLRWTISPGASTYRVQVATNIVFTQMLVDDSTVTATSFVPGVLPARVSCFWRVRAKGTAGSSSYCPVQAFTTGTFTPVEEEPGQIPSAFVLRQNYPNPFNPGTTIPFDISASSFVTLKVYDLLGREIQTLVTGEMPAGTYSVRWDGHSIDGQSIPSGLYFARMTVAAGQQTVVAVQKMLLLK